MIKVILNSVFLGLLILISCNNSTEVEETKDSLVKSHQEEVKDNFDHKKDLASLELGQNFVMQTQKVLAKNLINEINTKGTEHALTFCSVKAYPLTDSMAQSLSAQIKRVTDKIRNPDNKANKQEAAYITASKKLLAKGEKIKPEMTETNKKIVGYYPIMTNKMCLQCHGNPNTEVSSETLLRIKELYPNDKALDYKANELRGIWVIEMNKE